MLYHSLFGKKKGINIKPWEPLEELWVVDTETEANELIKLGWHFMGMVYNDREIKEWKGIFSQTQKTVATVSEHQFLMGRPNTVKPRKHLANYANLLEDVSDYAKRMRGKE